MDEWKSEGYASEYEGEEYEEYDDDEEDEDEDEDSDEVSCPIYLRSLALTSPVLIVPYFSPFCYNQNYVTAPLEFDPTDIEYVNDTETYQRFTYHYRVNYDSEVEPSAPPPEFVKAMLAQMFSAEGSI